MPWFMVPHSKQSDVARWKFVLQSCWQVFRLQVHVTNEGPGCFWVMFIFRFWVLGWNVVPTRAMTHPNTEPQTLQWRTHSDQVLNFAVSESSGARKVFLFWWLGFH